MTTLRPLRNTILFQFLDDTSGAKGRFAERTKGSIIIPVLDSAQHKTDRWGKVVSVGPDVFGVAPGEFVLVKALQWTFASEFEGKKIWKTNDEQVIVVTDDEESTFTSF
jgi:co-chaperonin GroES (HSP10)